MDNLMMNSFTEAGATIKFIEMFYIALIYEGLKVKEIGGFLPTLDSKRKTRFRGVSGGVPMVTSQNYQNLPNLPIYLNFSR